MVTSGEKMRLSAIAALAFALSACTPPGLIKDGDHDDLCGNDTTCRPLTEGEIANARQVFGDEIDYSIVRIFNPLSHIPYVNFGIKAISPDGNIYFPTKDYYEDDFSKVSYKMSVMMHELTHVWQHQHGENMVLQKIKSFFKAAAKGKSAYNYDINSPKRYSKYNIEQQAQMVEDYWDLRNLYYNVHSKDYWIETHCGEIEQLEEKMGQSLPIEPFGACKYSVPEPGC